MSLDEIPRIDPRALALALGGEAHGDHITAPSPGHSRKDRSLSILVDDHAPGGFVVHSFVGDDIMAIKDYVREKGGLARWEPTRQEAAPRPPERPHAVISYIYEDEFGEPFLRVTRMSDKSFRQARWTGESWFPGKPTGPKKPYRLPELLAASPDDPVFIVEGEKDADRLAAAGLIATTNSEGADGWTPDLSPWLKGRTVFVIPDNDIPGRRHAEKIMAITPGATMLILPGLGPKGDVSDWLSAGHTSDDLLALALSPPSIEPLPPGQFEPTTFSGEIPPPRPWAYGDFLMYKALTSIGAPPGVGKTTFSMQLGIAFALGINFGPWSPRPGGGGKVWLYNGEEPKDELDRRFLAACLEMDVDPARAAQRFFYNSGLSEKMQFVTANDHGDYVRTDHVELAKSIIREREFKLFMADPLIEFNGGSEDIPGMTAIGGAFRDIAADCDCSALAFHHTPKAANSDTAAGDMNALRGGSPLIGIARFVATMFTMSTKDAEAYGIEPSERHKYVRFDDAKANPSIISGEPKWWIKLGINLDNADSIRPADNVGVLRWQPLKLAGASAEERRLGRDRAKSEALDLVSAEIVRVCEAWGWTAPDRAEPLAVVVGALDREVTNLSPRFVTDLIIGQMGYSHRHGNHLIMITQERRGTRDFRKVHIEAK